MPKDKQDWEYPNQMTRMINSLQSCHAVAENKAQLQVDYDNSRRLLEELLKSPEGEQETE